MNICLSKFFMYLARCIVFAGWGVALYFAIESQIKYYCTEVLVLCIIYYIIAAFWIWSYIVCCWGDPGYLEDFYKEKNLLEALQTNSQIPNALQFLPRCQKCNLPKPNRAHHCSACGKCVFRFDHHCPYIGNCVGLYNIRAFILMIEYAGIQLILLALIYFLYRKSSISGIICAVFGASFVIMGINYIVSIVFNATTLENIQTGFSGHTIFARSVKENIKEIYPSYATILFPLRPAISGFYWSGLDPNNFDFVPPYYLQNQQIQQSSSHIQPNSQQPFQEVSNFNQQDNIQNHDQNDEIPKENVQKATIL